MHSATSPQSLKNQRQNMHVFTSQNSAPHSIAVSAHKSQGKYYLFVLLLLYCRLLASLIFRPQWKAALTFRSPPASGQSKGHHSVPLHSIQTLYQEQSSVQVRFLTVTVRPKKWSDRSVRKKQNMPTCSVIHKRLIARFKFKFKYFCCMPHTLVFPLLFGEVVSALLEVRLDGVCT